MEFNYLRHFQRRDLIGPPKSWRREQTRYRALTRPRPFSLSEAECGNGCGLRDYPKKLKAGAKCLYIGPLVQSTSGNTSKAVPSSKSDWTLMLSRRIRVGPTVPAAQQKVVFFPINFERNAFSEIYESKTYDIKSAGTLLFLRG